MFRFSMLLSLALLSSACTTNYPQTVGGVGGGLVGAGVGAAIGRSSSSISVAHGMGVGAAIGVPAGILLAYTSDAAAKYYIISSNENAISDNYRQIVINQETIEGARQVIFVEAPRGLPDEDRAEYIYLGPSLGNPWR